MTNDNNFVRALDRATKYESELLRPEVKIDQKNFGEHVTVTTTMVHQVRPEKKYIKIGVNDIVKNGLR